ncbi:hypothetical protein [Abyssicoccus albus]|uniref:Uncharacterized protein n=1 Tax=Abyssicoccus albus TaxID=1817405 RepID=A0A3N5BB88_9BACL|nr:hypothetical protein [Abyssicoccus albus]RPF54784.1 hypothetical protein EDD62_1745 [Abyssicoccus albus]
MTKGYTKEQLTNWKIESFDKIHWYISHVDVILTEDMYNEEEQQYDFEELYYRLRDIIYEFEDRYMSSEIEEE